MSEEQIGQASGASCQRRQRGNLRAVAARICDLSWSLHCQTATTASNVACDTRAAFHHAIAMARTVIYVRVCAGVAIAKAAFFQRASAPDHGWVCLRSPTGVGALTAACV